MRHTAVIYKAGTYIRITDYKPEFMFKILRPYCKAELFRYKRVPGQRRGSYTMELDHVYAVFNYDKTEMRMSLGFLTRFLQYAESLGYNKARIKVKDEEVIKGKEVDIAFKSRDIKPRNALQEDYIAYQSDPKRPVVINNCPTGEGKGFMTLAACVNIGKRVLFTSLLRYCPIMIKEIGNLYKIKPADVLYAKDYSVEEVHNAVKLGKVDPKIIIIPLSKIDIYIKRMKNEPDLPSLDEVYKDLEIGVRAIDEAHEAPYSVYMSLMYGNFESTQALSATLEGDDEFLNKIYKSLFPHDVYLRPPVYTKYMHLIAYTHTMNMAKYRIKYEGAMGYSHARYEESILRNKEAFENYYQLCKGVFKEYYLDTYRDGQKAAWFFARIDFCEAFNERLLQDYPDLDTVVFTSKISKKRGMEMEYANHRVLITTPFSCGTGKDIPKLYIVFSPMSMSSSQKQDQLNGRTRPIHNWWPDLDPIHLYFVNTCIDKQIEYSNKKRQVVAKKTKKFDIINSGVCV